MVWDIYRRWEQRPPVAWLVAGYLGYRAPHARREIDLTPKTLDEARLIGGRSNAKPFSSLPAHVQRFFAGQGKNAS